MSKQVWFLVLACVFRFAAAQSIQPSANISGTFYGPQARNELHLKTVERSIRIELTNIEWDGSFQTDPIRKYNLVRNLISGGEELDFPNGLNANREQLIADFQVSAAAYAGFNHPTTAASILSTNEKVLRLSDTKLQIIIPYLPEFNLMMGTRENVHFREISGTALSDGYAISAHTGAAHLSGPVYEYLPSKDDIATFIPTSELQTVTSRYVHVDLVGNVFAYDIPTNSDKRHRIVLAILARDTNYSDTNYSHGLWAHANAGAFDDQLVRVNDTRIRLTLTAQASLNLPAGATERIAHADLPADSVLQYISGSSNNTNNTGTCLVELCTNVTDADRANAPVYQIDRAGQTGIDVRSPTAKYSGNFFSNEPTTSSEFSGEYFTDLALRTYTYYVTLVLHGSTWKDLHTLMNKCGLRGAVLNSDRPKTQEGYSSALTASIHEATHIFITLIDPTEILITIRMPEYQLPPHGSENIIPVNIPSACVSTTLDISNQQQWLTTETLVNGSYITTGQYTTLVPSETIVSRTATFSGNFFQDVSFDYDLRSQTVHIELSYEKWRADVTSDLQQLHSLVKSVFKSSRNVAYPDYYTDGVDAALERGYFHTSSSHPSFSYHRSLPAVAATVIFANRTSDKNLTIFVNAIPLLQMPPHGSEIIRSAGIPAICVQARDDLLMQDGDFSTTIKQRTLVYNGFYTQAVTTAKHISAASHTVTLDLYYDTWTSTCIHNSTMQQELLGNIFSSTLNNTHSFHTFLQNLTVSTSGNRLIIQIPDLPSYTSLPSSYEDISISTVPTQCLSTGFDLSVKVHSSCTVDGAHQHRAVLKKSGSCMMHPSTMIYAKAVAVYSGNFFFGLDIPRPPSYLQPSPGHTLDFTLEVELFDAAWALEIPHSYEKQIDVISMVLRSNKRRSAPDFLTTGWEALTWPDEGKGNKRLVSDVDLVFELLTPTVLRITIPRLANYELSTGTGEIISGGFINQSVLLGGTGTVEYRHGLSDLRIVLPDGAHQNIARGKSTKQSSDTDIQPVGYSYKAVDDLLSLHYPDGACSLTLYEERPWWRVDLGSDVSIRMVAFVTPEHADTNTTVIEVRLGSQRSRASVQARVHPLCGTRVAPPGAWLMVPCAGRVGRWLTLRATHATELALCEVQVFSAGSLISRDRAAEQSSSHMVYSTELSAKLATDGYRFPSLMDGSCAVTLSEHDPWWRVSLDFSYKVRAVLLWLKTNSPIVEGDTLVNTTVRVGDSIENNGRNNNICGTILDESSLSMTTCSNRDGTATSCPTQEVVCDPELVGRYVTVVISPQLGPDGYPESLLRVLSLCEVEVYGVECDESCHAMFDIQQARLAAHGGQGTIGVGKNSRTCRSLLNSCHPGGTQEEFDTYDVNGDGMLDEFAAALANCQACEEWAPPPTSDTHVITWGVNH